MRFRRVEPLTKRLVHAVTFQDDVAKSELHELLLNYIRVRSALIGAEKRVSALTHDVEANKESVWTMRDDKVEESGECADEKEVTAVLQFKVPCGFNKCYSYYLPYFSSSFEGGGIQRGSGVEACPLVQEPKGVPSRQPLPACV